MKWEFFDLRSQPVVDAEFIKKIRDAYVASFYRGSYPHSDLPFKSLEKRLELSTDLAILEREKSEQFYGYAIFSIPEAMFQGKRIIWQDSIAVDPSLQGRGYSKKVYEIIRSTNHESGWLGGRTQNPTIIKSFCKKGKSFPFDELYSSETGKELFSFLYRNIPEVKESVGVDISTGIVKGKYSRRLGSYPNDWTGVETQKEFLERNDFNQDNGDAVIIAIEEFERR